MISTSVKPELFSSRSIFTGSTSFLWAPIALLLRHVAAELSCLGTVRIVPCRRDVDLLASRHRDGVGYRPGAGEHGCRVGECASREGQEVRALQFLQLDLRGHEPRRENPALSHAAGARR